MACSRFSLSGHDLDPFILNFFCCVVVKQARGQKRARGPSP